MINTPPKPNKEYPVIYVDYAWQEQVCPTHLIPVPPAPKKGFNQLFIDNKWTFIKKDLLMTH